MLTTFMVIGALLSAGVELDEEEAAGRGPHEVRIEGDNIELRFFPDRSAAVDEPCSDIGHIQVVQMWAVYTDKAIVVMPGQLRARDAWLDATASDSGHVVDTCRRDDPVYQDPDRRGSSTGAVASMLDAPNLQASDFAPYHPQANPGGWAKMTWRFLSYAYCAAGEARGTFYEGVGWTWDVYANAVRPGDGRGEATLINDHLPPPRANAEVRQALARYLAAPSHPQVCAT
ncbi:MAG: hypothetical protein KC636_22255 [Myxococcales bacterium]|nr:hypothetical protein [Myxococcales bacterium]